MNKFTILFLTLFLALPIAMKADSAKEKKDDSRYLVGAVPEVDGKVIFSKEFQIPGMSQAQIYDTVMKWMTERLKENQNVDSRVVYADEDKGTIAGIGEEWIVFSSSALSLDRTLINYQITVPANPATVWWNWKKSVSHTVIQKSTKRKNGLPTNTHLIKQRLS